MATNIDYITEVQKLYVSYFSRPGDPGGVAFWFDKLQTNAVTYDQVSAEFAASPEYLALYGGRDNASLVTEVYDNLFGRAPDATGMDFWTTALNRGDATFQDVARAVAAGAQNDDRVAYNGKVAVATKFTQHVDTDPERIAYSGAAANQVAADYLAQVRDLQSAAMQMDAGQIDAAIARIVGLPGGLAIEPLAAI